MYTPRKDTSVAINPLDLDEGKIEIILGNFPQRFSSDQEGNTVWEILSPHYENGKHTVALSLRPTRSGDSYVEPSGRSFRVLSTLTDDQSSTLPCARRISLTDSGYPWTFQASSPFTSDRASGSTFRLCMVEAFGKTSTLNNLVGTSNATPTTIKDTILTFIRDKATPETAVPSEKVPQAEQAQAPSPSSA